ncbi:alpha/beta hydrolase [Hymenobacter weizhouensis]|uniref:alpha/beta hydrolase n=1 Tax=Hymenobacter sp. YIM 151500-1 TaxID=2987689 RepID=UPI002226CC6C|nr:alpha/beta hydrolase family protein [Hymenobacter sp. YIM 151500-1]UYZ64701.1 esterase family protein [Hymenobacter sp. YIM 151500-1]
MRYLRFLLVALLLGPAGCCFGARVDTLDIPSAVMGKTYRATVVLPAAYAKQKKAVFPVLYLLHGATGHFSDWLTKTPDKLLVHRLADQYNLLVVMPEGETFGWYLDSPVNKGSQFETYLTQEVIQKIDNTYRTVRRREGRVITGLSMGGHGALYLATRHPDLYCAAGSMSGAVDINTAKWRLNPEEGKRVAALFEPILGPLGPTPAATLAPFTVLPLVDKMRSNGLPLIIDCGVDDFLIEPNRELHRRLVYNGTPHEYTERPGGHTWEYWQNSLPYHVLFLHKVLQANAVTVP